MAASPESSSTSVSAQYLSDLEAGLTAFKRGDFATAVLLLESSLSSPSDDPLTAKAQMGLTVAYEKMGEPERAAQVCNGLAQNINPQVQEWAAKTLSALVKRHPRLADSVSQTTPEKVLEGESSAFQRVRSDADPSGFVPLTVSPASTTTKSPNLPPLSPPIAPAEQPVAVNSPPPVQAVPYEPSWRQAGRARQPWKPLGRLNPIPLIAAQVVTAIALYWFLQQFTYQVSVHAAIALTKVPFLHYQRMTSNPPTTEIVVLLVILFISSRWLLDGLLILLYGMQPLSLKQLATHSPETTRSLAQWCNKQRIPVPALGVLPIAVPIAFSYGALPWIARTVVSQGLLDQLTDDEIATIYANEVGHLSYWTVPLMSLVAVLTQLPYTLYRLVANWGDRQSLPILRVGASGIAALSYGLYWLVRAIGLWLSRQRVGYSDRVAATLTGNPNGYARALLKIAIGTAQDVQQQKQTRYLLESFDLLTPLGHHLATWLGSLHPYRPLDSLLNWERTNPYRDWLAVNNTHPPTGERLGWLMAYARQWQLGQELEWATPPTQRSQHKALTGAQWQGLLRQGAPYFGLLFGVMIAYLLSCIGAIGQRANWEIVSWMSGDRTLLGGLPLIGFSLGSFLRLNSCYPEPASAQLTVDPPLPDILQQAAKLPCQPQLVQIKGLLLGRLGSANFLNSDLLLQTSQGIIRLHCTDSLGPLGDLFPKPIRPVDLVNQPVIVTGWLRRGATPWIDVDALKTSSGRVSRSGHPVWATIVAAIAALWGIWIVLNL